ncbi:MULTISPECIES: hypothetical protein [unclassified Rhizobium]|uniref:hypothetical protein n=1 Tax=unclassified Rhizobium TaxID=2613769 RepID=UPI0037FA791C
MSGWNHDISAAPRDRQILMRTTRGDKVFVTNWLEPTKHTPNGRFNGCSENAKTLLAWCEIPEFTNAPEGQTDATGTAYERDEAQSVPAHLTDSNTVAGGLSCSAQSETAKSHPTTLAGEIAAQREVGAFESVCPALIDDVGGF